ncbi:MAG: hypothetical protein SH868_08045 [Bythopirellula sp.]|nr:hypothetical protein [Bythopirellula sp.]
MQENMPIYFSADWSMLLVIVGVVALLTLIIKGNHGLGFVRVFMVLVAAGIMLYFVTGGGQEPPSDIADVVITADSQTPKSDPTHEALWDKLTKSRINLEGEAESVPLADPKDEAAKQAVRETFGLDAEGKMPPKWVVNPPKRVGEVLRETVASDPFVTEEECLRQLEQEQLPHVVARRIGDLASAKMGQSVTSNNPLSVGIGTDYILREIARDEFVGTVDTSVGEMKVVHVLLEFNPQVDQHLTAAWLRHERHQRLASFSKIVAMSLIGLAAVYGMLRFDTWSQGYYSKQLLVGGVLAIIAFAVVFLR